MQFTFQSYNSYSYEELLEKTRGDEWSDREIR